MPTESGIVQFRHRHLPFLLRRQAFSPLGLFPPISLCHANRQLCPCLGATTRPWDCSWVPPLGLLVLQSSSLDCISTTSRRPLTTRRVSLILSSPTPKVYCTRNAKAITRDLPPPKPCFTTAYLAIFQIQNSQSLHCLPCRVAGYHTGRITYPELAFELDLSSTFPFP
jgi:hypothetical protein